MASEVNWNNMDKTHMHTLIGAWERVSPTEARACNPPHIYFSCKCGCGIPFAIKTAFSAFLFFPPPFFSSSIHSLLSVSTSLSRFHIWSPRFSSRGGAAPAQKQSSFVRRAHTYCVVTADQCKHEREVQHTEESRRQVWGWSVKLEALRCRTEA